MPETSTVTSRIAGLTDGPQQVISGVAVGAGDVTRGLSGDQKVWTPEELKEAAETLEGGDLKALHSETPVGTVTDAGYVEGEGVVYEARVDDAELAEAIANGRLTVSVEAKHADGGTVDTDRGEAMRAADIEFSDLAIVQRGAAPSASAEPGEAAALEAALAPAAIHAALEDDEEDPASTEGDASDIDISESTEEGLENKVEEHNEAVESGKQVTLSQLKKVFRRGAGAWFSSNKGATQQQWAYARVNEALDDIKDEKAINHGNDNDIFADSLDYDPPESERSAADDIQITDVPGIDQRPDRITRDLLVSWVRWTVATSELDELANWNPALHPRDDEGKFVERGFDVPDGLGRDEISETPTSEVLQKLASKGADVEAVLTDPNVRIDGIDDSVGSVKDLGDGRGDIPDNAREKVAGYELTEASDDALRWTGGEVAGAPVGYKDGTADIDVIENRNGKYIARTRWTRAGADTSDRQTTIATRDTREAAVKAAQEWMGDNRAGDAKAPRPVREAEGASARPSVDEDVIRTNTELEEAAHSAGTGEYATLEGGNHRYMGLTDEGYMMYAVTFEGGGESVPEPKLAAYKSSVQPDGSVRPVFEGIDRSAEWTSISRSGSYDNPIFGRFRFGKTTDWWDGNDNPQPATSASASASAALVEVNGTEVDLEAPARVKNAIEAAMDAKEEYADEIGDCGTGVGEEMGQTILDDDLTPEIITSGGDIAQYGPATYLDGHGDEGPATDDPPTDWGREEWLGITDGGSPRCGPVQLGLWGYYLDWFEDAKQEVEAAMEDSDMADDMTVPEAYRFSNPGEAVEQAKFLGVGEDRDLAGDEMIHTREMDDETMFFPAPSREALLDRLRAEGELADPLVDRPTGGDTRTVVHTPTEETPDEATLDAIRESVADRTGVELSMTATEAGVLTEATPDVGIGVREFMHEHLDIVESVVQNALGKPQKSSLHVAGDADGLSLHPCFEVGGELEDATLSRMAETFALVANHGVAVGMTDGMIAFDPRDPVLSHAALDVAEIITRRAADEAGVRVTGNTFRAAEMLDDAEVVEPPSLPAEAGHHDMGEDDGEDAEMAVDVAIPMPSESVQLLYPEQSVAADAARAMDLGNEEDADGDITHPHDFEGETWYMPGADHGIFVDAVSGMDAGMAGVAPVAKLNEYKAVGPIEFRGTREGDLDESAIPSDSDEYESHYFNAADTKSESSFPLVDGEGYLRRGNLDAAWDLRGQGDLGMPRDAAERLMLNLGLVFGPPGSEANPLPQAAYDERDDVGTPYAEEAAALAAVVDAVAGPARPDDPETGEVFGDAAATTAALSTMTDDPAHDAALGSYLANAMAGKMEEMAYSEDMSYAEMMREMASHCGMSESHMRSIRRGDTGCPSLEAIEAMSDVLDADMGMLLAAAERDGCEYSEAGHYGGGSGGSTDSDKDNTEARMADSTTKELKATLADKTERIEELESEIADLRAERDAVATEYAEALAGTDTVLDAETMAEKFSVAELAEMYDDAVDAELAEDDPVVRSGSSGEASDANAALSASERERVAELEEERDEWAGRDSRLAEARLAEIDDELAELTGDAQ